MTVRTRIILLSVLVAYVPVSVAAVSAVLYLTTHWSPEEAAEKDEGEEDEGEDEHPVGAFLDEELPGWRDQADSRLSRLLYDASLALIVDGDRGVVAGSHAEGTASPLRGLSVGQAVERLRGDSRARRLLLFDAGHGLTVIAGFG
jgi:hypothetical protein